MQASISLIGSTGSIGTQTLDVARKLGLRVTALSAHSSVKLLEQQCREFKPKYVCIGEEKYSELKLALNDIDIEILCGVAVAVGIYVYRVYLGVVGDIALFEYSASVVPCEMPSYT